MIFVRTGLLRTFFVYGSVRKCLTPALTREDLHRGRKMATAAQYPPSVADKTLETLKLDNLVLRALPVDPVRANHTRPVSGACFSRVDPTSLDGPETVIYSRSAMKLLDLPDKQLDRPEFAEYFSGNRLLPGSDTASHCYCGHQFGYFSGQLGDGAAIYLGEVVNSDGERWEIQLKGAGKTPYSRHADGRKVLRSSIREFLCSEAMHHLGVPSTRAGSCVTSETRVVRDLFYTGNPVRERATVVLRLAPTFLRFGSFEIFKPVDGDTGRAGPSVGRNDILHKMLKYTIETFFQKIWSAHKDDELTMYEEFYKEVVRNTARLVAGWQAVGFCHGVLNTDNMSILGLTIDYGPYGFMDRFDPDFICNSSDDGGRYTYRKQPEICRWNCGKFAEAIQEAIPLERTNRHLELFDEVFEQSYMEYMRKKFGLGKVEKQSDKELFDQFFETMHKTGADFTNCFRCLSDLQLPGTEAFDECLENVKKRLLSQCCTADELKKSCEPRMDPRQLQMFLMIAQSNPDLLSQLGPGVKGLMQELERLEKSKELKDMTSESKSANDDRLWTAWLESYTGRLKEERTQDVALQLQNETRSKGMNAANPRFVLRNYIAQNAIEAAEQGDYSEVNRVLRVLETPYSEVTDDDLLKMKHMALTADVTDSTDSSSPAHAQRSYADDVLRYDSRPPLSSIDIRVS